MGSKQPLNGNVRGISVRIEFECLFNGQTELFKPTGFGFGSGAKITYAALAASAVWAVVLTGERFYTWFLATRWVCGANLGMNQGKTECQAVIGPNRRPVMCCGPNMTLS